MQINWVTCIELGVNCCEYDTYPNWIQYSNKVLYVQSMDARTERDKVITVQCNCCSGFDDLQ